MDPLGVMKTFGWTSEKVMQGYTRIPSAALRERYVCAMEEAEREEANGAQSESLEAYFDSDESQTA